MTFPDTLDEFLEQYQFKDSEEIYTNGSMLIPVFRVKQWEKHTYRMRERVSVGNVMEYRHVKYDPDEFFSAERNSPPLLWRDDLITTTEFMTHSGQNGYELHFRTPDRTKYRYVEDACRKMIDHGKPHTNADRIRQMSDEELAEWLEEHCFQYGWLDWLKQEVEE
jgi:hypothetical protein